MNKKDSASISILKIIGISLIIILICGVSVMATEIDFRTVKITMSNGYEMTVITTKTNVAEILEDNSIIVEDDERVTPTLDEEISDNNEIKITNKSEQEIQIAKISESGIETTLDEILKSYSPIIEKIVVEQETIPFETITKDVAQGATDTKNKVIKQGEDGIKEVTYKVKHQNDIEIEKIKLSEKVVKEPVDKIVQIQRNVVTSRSTSNRTSSTATTSSYVGAKWSYTSDELDLMCAITAQECSSSYNGALAVITTACNRAESRGTDPLTEYKRTGQFCYSIDSHWKKRLNGNYSASVFQAVIDALNGKRNHNYFSFRSASSGASGVNIGGNVYF